MSENSGAKNFDLRAAAAAQVMTTWYRRRLQELGERRWRLHHGSKVNQLRSIVPSVGGPKGIATLKFYALRLGMTVEEYAASAILTAVQGGEEQSMGSFTHLGEILANAAK